MFCCNMVKLIIILTQETVLVIRVIVKLKKNPPQTVRSLSFVLQKSRIKMKSRGMHEKLKVDPEDEVMDAYSYYKCADFEP